jgi:hypothetical protein
MLAPFVTTMQKLQHGAAVLIDGRMPERRHNRRM